MEGAAVLEPRGPVGDAVVEPWGLEGAAAVVEPRGPGETGGPRGDAIVEPWGPGGAGVVEPQELGGEMLALD